MSKNFLFTSESVSEGHPDKVCDRISDMVVDTYLSQEPFARVACETLATTNKVVLAGETRGPKINSEEIIEKVHPIGATLFAKRGINLILKIRLQMEATPINPKHPRAIKDEGTCTYIILTESPWI